MRKFLFILLLCGCSVLLCGCMEFNQVEDLAFAEILGIDINDENRIEASIQIPKISGQRGEDGGSGGSSALVYSASGETLDEALHLLQWAVPRRLDLSQIELIVVSESLAQDERFRRTANTIMATPRLYPAAKLAVCRGNAKKFLSQEKPAIGTRTSTELAATFADYARNGFIPNATFADVFYRTRSVYSDALAIYADTLFSPQSGQNKNPQSSPASAMFPSESTTVNTEIQRNNRFLGAAVFHDGQMVGLLSAEEYLWCKILRGESQTFPYAAESQTVGLTTLGKPDIRINTSARPMQIDVSLRFAIVSSSGSAPTEQLQTSIKRELENTIHRCQQMHTEPFYFADAAAGAFPTFEEWTAFQWFDRFADSSIHLNVQVHNSKS